MINKKAKGTAGERELVHKFWKNGWACIRTAGSGSMKYPSPDLIAGNSIRKLAIECKVINSRVKYIKKAEIKELIEFSRKFGAESYVAVKFNDKNWYFLSIDDLNESEENYVINIELAKRKGLLFEEIIDNF